MAKTTGPVAKRAATSSANSTRPRRAVPRSRAQGVPAPTPARIPRAGREGDQARQTPPTDIRSTLRVRATDLGYYADARRRPGDVFTLTTAKHFTPKWMQWVAARTPERITTGQAELQRLHDEKVGGHVRRVDEAPEPTGEDDIL